MGDTMVREFTQEDLNQYEQALNELRASGFATDAHHGDGATTNGQIIVKYFQDNPTIPVTKANVTAMVEHNRKLFSWLSKAEQEIDKFFAESPNETRQLHQWLSSQAGKPGMLAVTNNNLAILLAELRGRPITHETIQQALGRIMFRPNKLEWVPEPRRVNAMQKSVDPDHKPGRLFETSA